MSAIASVTPSAAALKLPGFWQRARHHRSFVIGGVLAALPSSPNERLVYECEAVTD